MIFADREEAGKKLAKKLQAYKDKNAVVYTLPRGGVVVGYEIAKKLHLPLEIVVTRKIGRQNSPEYAIAAIAEDGHTVLNEREVQRADPKWFEEAKKQELEEAKRRREVYGGSAEYNVKGKTVLLVDDGVATGLSMQMAIEELRHHGAKNIVLAVPVILGSPSKVISPMVEKVIALETPGDAYAVSTYYKHFTAVEDNEVISLLKNSLIQ